MATSNAGVVYYCPAKNVPQKMCNVPAKRLRWSEASFLIFGGTLFFDFFISGIVKIHEKMTYLTYVSIVKMFHFVDF